MPRFCRGGLGVASYLGGEIYFAGFGFLPALRCFFGGRAIAGVP